MKWYPKSNSIHKLGDDCIKKNDTYTYIRGHLDVSCRNMCLYICISTHTVWIHTYAYAFKWISGCLTFVWKCLPLYVNNNAHKPMDIPLCNNAYKHMNIPSNIHDIRTNAHRHVGAHKSRSR